MFAEVVGEVSEKTLLMMPEATQAAARELLGVAGPTGLDGLLLPLRSASSKPAVQIMRDHTEVQLPGQAGRRAFRPQRDGPLPRC